jgi:hypothetical protein
VDPNTSETGDSNGEPPDVTKSGTYLRIGVFVEREDGTVVRKESLRLEDVRPIVERHADRNDSGLLIRGKPPRDGNGTTLGYVEGLPIVMRTEGELHVLEMKKPPARFEALFQELCMELRCAACLQVVGGRTSRLIRFVPGS